MRIESHGFGNMVIAGRRYTSDLVIYPDGRVADNWWRRQGHVLAAEDLADLVAAAPEVIVAGTGVYGRVKPAAGLAAFIAERGIRLVAAANDEAVKRFNVLAVGTKVVGACFHLTC